MMILEAPMPVLGLRVRFVRKDHVYLPEGSEGTIDVISLEDPNLFWVHTDEGGFFGWTSFRSWKPIQ